MTQVDAVDHVLRTTRSVRRRIDFDRPIEPEVIEACIAAAVQAPTGLDREAWRFVVVTDPAPKAALAALYREAFDDLGLPPETDVIVSTREACSDAEWCFHGSLCSVRSRRYSASACSTRS